jgi:hypothetical protein
LSPTNPRIEKDVKERIKKLLNEHDWFWFMPPANGMGRTGIADIIAVKRGVFLAIEAKFGKNPPTAMQIGFLNSIRAQDGFAFVVNEDRLNSLRIWLEAFDRATTTVQGEKKMLNEDGANMIDAIRVMTLEL